MIPEPRSVNATVDLARAIANAQRIFRGEVRHGCANRLVNGGLEAFVRYWQTEVCAKRPPAEWLERVAHVGTELAGYANMTRDERRTGLERALAALEGDAPVPVSLAR